LDIVGPERRKVVCLMAMYQIDKTKATKLYDEKTRREWWEEKMASLSSLRQAKPPLLCCTL
jgi:hypothetical protein